MGVTLELAERVIKARRSGTCNHCLDAVHVGQRIALLPSTGWVHVACILKRLHATA